MARRTLRMSQRKKDKFLAAYARLGTITDAAKEVGISRMSHRRWLASEAYRKAFEAAEDESTEVLEKEALRRAVEGREEPVYFNGVQVGTTRKYSDVLLIFMLKARRPDVYRERYDARIQGALNIQSAVKVIHEYHDGAPAIEAIAAELEPNARLMAATAGELLPGESDDPPEE